METANDGVEALEKTYRLRPDLVILDLNMPNLDGFGYCERVRNDAELPRMPIIVQTAIDDRETKLRTLSCGADDFLHKPLDMDELNLCVLIHLERYFLLQDMSLMCTYLKMEMEQGHEMLQQMQKANAPSNVLHRLTRHCETLETLATISAFRLR